MSVMPAPRYLGSRWRTSHGDRLLLWHAKWPTGRRRVSTDDCPQCADGRIEVGADSSVEACRTLATYLLRKERGPRAAEELAARFCDEIIQYLPNDVPWWWIDACSIREWVDDTGRVLAGWSGQQRTLPPDGHTVPKITQPLLHLPGQSAPIVLPPEVAAAMSATLSSIDGDGF